MNRGDQAAGDLLAAVTRGATDGWSRVADADYDLAGAEHDRVRPPGATMRSYVLCTTPRSGSSLLAEALHHLGDAGTPIEYFDPTNAMRVLWRRWGCSTLPGYVDLLHARRCSTTGLFGLKLHWFQLQALSRASADAQVDPRSARSAGGRPDELDPDTSLDRAVRAFRWVAPRAKVIRVRRRDVERQATSWACAERTGRWSSQGEAGAEPEPVAADELAHFIGRVRAEEQQWSELLDRLDVDPCLVHYEDLSDHYSTTVATVARHIGRPVDAADVPPPRLVHQSP